MFFPDRTRARVAAALAAAALLAGCADPPAADPPPADPPAGGPPPEELAPIHVTEDSIHSPDGSVLLRIEDLDVSIQVDSDIAFGAADRFLDASLSPDGDRIAFIHEGPAGDRTLSVADGRRPAATVQDASRDVRAPGHEEMPPEERIYEVRERREGRLLFHLAGQDWLFHPATGEVRDEE